MFFNKTFNAYNVAEVSINQDHFASIAQLASSQAINDCNIFTHTSPNWSSDIRWIAPNTLDGYRHFQSVFKRLEIDRHVSHHLDLQQKIILYSGFIVSRSCCTSPNFHLDWIDTRGQAYTFLSPLNQNSTTLGLLYKDINGHVRRYDYRLGRCLLIGDHFLHSTMPGEIEAPAHILSFTFGTDKMEYWDSIMKTVSGQGNLYRRPDGSFIARDID